MADAKRFEDKRQCPFCKQWILCRVRADMNKHQRTAHPVEHAEREQRAKTDSASTDFGSPLL